MVGAVTDPMTTQAVRWRKWMSGPRAWLRSLAGVPVVVVGLLIWQWQTTRHPVFFLPPPLVIARRLKTDWLSGPAHSLFLSHEGLTAIVQTFQTALIGWAIAAALGIIVGSVLGVRPSLAAFAAPPLLLLRSVPPIAVIPIAIVILGLGDSMRTAVVVAGCLWPILLNAVAAVSGVDQVLRDVAALNHLNPIQTFVRVLVPAASPKLFAGLRVALALAIVLSVGAGMFAGSGGLGGRLLTFQNNFDVPGLWATITVLAVLGAIVNWLLLLVERSALRWNIQGETL